MQSSKARNQIQEEKEEGIKALSVEKLQQQFLNLQQDWEIFKLSNPRTRETLARSNTITTTTTRSCYSSSSSNDLNNVVKTLDHHLLDKISPRTLMSALQSNNNNVVDHHCLTMTITRTSDSDVQEIVRDRRKAIESGSLKGRRRLFESNDDDDDTYGIGLVDQDDDESIVHEVRSVVSFDESEGENDEFLDDDDHHHDHDGNKAVLVRRYSFSQVVLKENIRREEMNGKILLSRGNVTLIVVLIFVVFAVCVFGYFSEFDIGESHEVILVPT